ncbi:adenylosuccinate lyase, partial [Candidatus Woesearchaeota archaeon]|nr:adenylosuccinate lyase [Candidatus Woesearchaeota archaeon]
ESMTRNFGRSRGMIAAEPAYLLLAAYGHPDAHEFVRKLTLDAERTGKGFSELLFSSREAAAYIKKMSRQQQDVLKSPERYTGMAAQKTENVCKHWEEKLWKGMRAGK